MRLTELAGRTVAIWGTGREGTAAARACSELGLANLVAIDENADPSTTNWQVGDRSIPVHSREHGLGALLAAEVVIKSPGISRFHPWITKLHHQGVLITSGTTLWMADHTGQTIGVTGSKGKSTTASLIHHLLTAVGRPNELGGNIGIPVLTLPATADLYVVELSSYHCAELVQAPRVAVITALFPEHLDWHGSEEQYYQDKLNILTHLPDHVVINGLDDRLVAAVGAAAAPEITVTTTGKPDSFHMPPSADGAPYFYYGETALFPRSALPLLGRHNERNLCVALGALAVLGIDCVAERKTLEAAVAEFEALPHRLSQIPDPSGITFVDDTLSTAPQAAIHAMEAFADRPLTLIVGGNDRGIDYSPLRQYFVNRETAITVIGIPDSGRRILEMLEGLPTVQVELADDLGAAVVLARRLTPPGGVVLLSPAAPSYGQFANYERRSAAFLEAIQATAAAAV